MKKKTFVQIFLICLVLICVFYHLLHNIDKILAFNWKINYSYLFPFLTVFLIGPSLKILGWKMILKSIGAELSSKRCSKIMSFSQLLKYLPGVGWSYMGQYYLGMQEGISKFRVTTSMLLENIINITTGLFVFMASLIFWRTQGISQGLIYFLVLIPLGLLFLHPRIFNKTTNFVLRKLKKNESNLHIKYRSILRLFCYYSLCWCVTGLILFLFIRSLLCIEIGLSATTGISAISFVAGFLAIFVPAGLGVREGVMTALLSIYLPIEITIVITLFFRFLIIIRELIYGGIALSLDS